MCGIIFAVSRNAPFQINEADLETLRARGPDSLQTHSVSIKLNDSIRYLSFVSTVLSLRGSTVQKQPLIDQQTGSVFCWNGEVWTYDESPVQGNDSQFIFDQLLHAIAGCDLDDSCAAVRSEAVTKTLTSVAGPYAFVFYDAPAATVYYARDSLGRRSLIADHDNGEVIENSTVREFVVSSFDTTLPGSGVEVSTTGIYCVKLRGERLSVQFLPWLASTLKINRNAISIENSVANLPSDNAVDSLARHLCESLQLRISDVPTYNFGTTITTAPSRVAILFSGGIDCTLLARLSHDQLLHDQPIDLLNVAFENPRTIRAALANKAMASTMTSPYELCPDRITGRLSFDELCSNCPGRLWRFVAINIPHDEVLHHRSTIIRLMRPHNTEMDLSIAMALYFAARGMGSCHSYGSTEIQGYTTPARVLLSGLGADELFGGYSRHAAAFNRGGYDQLNDELEMDFARIGTRNLGRDDRVTSHWSREIRYPFLDERFVKFALALPAYEKIGFRTGKPILKHFEEGPSSKASTIEDLDPTKMILRCLMWNLGMKRSANERKRAIQFGARTAKMDGGRTKGTDVLQTR